MAKIPDRLPVFSVPNLVLLPGADLPVRLYDPAYVGMIKEALDGNRLLLVGQMQFAFADESEATPALYPIGCIGVITHANEHKDGYHIFLHGLSKARIGDTLQTEPYRMVAIEPMEETPESDDVSERSLCLRQDIMHTLGQHNCQQVLDPFPEGALERLNQASVHNFIALAALLLKLEPHEQQKLLEMNGSLERLSELHRQLNHSLLNNATLGDQETDGEGGYTH